MSSSIKKIGKIWIKKGNVDSASFMAYSRWKTESKLTKGFEYKPKILNYFAEQAIKSDFYNYYQLFHEDSTEPVGITAFSICHCPYYNKAIFPNSAYLNPEYRGLGFYRKVYKLINRLIKEEEIGVFYTNVNYINYTALEGR